MRNRGTTASWAMHLFSRSEKYNRNGCPRPGNFKCTLAFLLSCLDNSHLHASVSKSCAELPNAPTWISLHSFLKLLRESNLKNLTEKKAAWGHFFASTKSKEKLQKQRPQLHKTKNSEKSYEVCCLCT